ARVQTSFVQVTRRDGALAERFYETLFDIAPHYRAMFPDDMTAQRDKLTRTLAAAVLNLDSFSDIRGVIADMGARHADYGVVDDDYEIVGAALIRALGHSLGVSSTPDVLAAWGEAYALVADAMKAGAAAQADGVDPISRS
ncbi:MAG: globin domain-containing protein, partial [Pseudomonadota bacterium]